MRWLGVSVGLILLLMWASPVEAAVAPQFTDLPTSINVDQEIEVSVSFAGNKGDYADKTYYLRGVFYKTGTNYFGLTQNNYGNWIETSSDRTQFYEFNTDSEGSWSGKLRVKANSDSDNFNGSGGYYFKTGRYTATFNSGAVWSEEKTVEISGLSPTPTASPAPTPTPTTPTPKATAGAAATPKPTASAQVLAAKEEATETGEVKLEASSTGEVEEPLPSPAVKIDGRREKQISLGLVAGGMTLVGIALFPFLRKWYHNHSWLKTFLKGGDQSSFGQE